jgi:hypothetical protein
MVATDGSCRPSNLSNNPRGNKKLRGLVSALTGIKNGECFAIRQKHPREMMINYDMNIRNSVFLTSWSENVFNPPSARLNGQIMLKIDNPSKYGYIKICSE